MKNRKTNWYLNIGLGLYAFLMGLKHFIELPHLIYGLGLGTVIVFEVLGLISIKHDLTEMRARKKRLFCKLVK